MSNFHFRPGTWDDIIFNCVNRHNEYRLPSTFAEQDVILDIGAHIGSFGYACLSRGAGKVYAYEAMLENFELAKSNLAQFGDKADVQRAAVWRSDKEVSHLNFSESTESQNTGGGNVWTPGTWNPVPALSFDKILDTINQPIKLLKLDCEGSEFPILFTSKKLSMVESICGEYHEFGGSFDSNLIASEFKVDGYEKYTITELTNFLIQQGFNVTFTRSQNPDRTPCNLGLFFATRD